MKLMDVIKTVGSGAVRELIPGGGMLIEAVNAWLPEDKRLPVNATGSDIGSAVGSLPPEQRAQLMAKEFDVDLTRIREANETVRAMLDADTKNPHTTRPHIAKGAFYVVAFTSVVTVLAWAYGVLTGNAEIVGAVTDGYAFVLSVIGPLVTLLWAYFGILRAEQKNRLDAARGNSTPSGVGGILANIVTRK